MVLDRRRFLVSAAGAAALAALPLRASAARGGRGASKVSPRLASAQLTTLAQTLGPGPAGPLGYRPVVTRPGEPYVAREELAAAGGERASSRTSLLCFVHLTDQHIVDVQSPSRVEFLDRYNENSCSGMPFSAAYRPHEAASARISDAMLRRLRAVGVSPVTGAPIAAMVSTGDNTDNQQENELALFLGLMDGGVVTPQSGDPSTYEGVQASGDLSYWHPDPAVPDHYKTAHGFPAKAGWLEEALMSFTAVGAGVPWYTCYGNHDGLAQGNVPPNAAFERIGVGGTKVTGPVPGLNPCEPFAPTVVGPGFATTPDPRRRYVSRREWVQAHLDSPGLPAGHGFSASDAVANRAYYAADVGALRFITLDSVNPGGYDAGSIGDVQLQWLSAELARADAEQRMVVLFSHHGPRSLDNPNAAPNPQDVAGSDLPRHQADEVLAVVDAHRCVIAWVNGHTHDNVVVARGAGAGSPFGWWDIGTAAHIDWPAQSRLLDVVDNHDGTLSIFATMIDHDDDPVASLARELAGNDPQKGFSSGTGGVEDRNVELVVVHPFSPA